MGEGWAGDAVAVVTPFVLYPYYIRTRSQYHQAHARIMRTYSRHYAHANAIFQRSFAREHALLLDGCNHEREARTIPKILLTLKKLFFRFDEKTKEQFFSHAHQPVRPLLLLYKGRITGCSPEPHDGRPTAHSRRHKTETAGATRELWGGADYSFSGLLAWSVAS